MAIRRVRIYNSPEGGADVIGFSASATDAPDNPAFNRFFESRGYEVNHLTAGWKEEGDGIRFAYDEPQKIPPEGVSLRYVEVRPPLSDEHIHDLGALCVGGFIDGEPVGAIVDPYHNFTFVIDNREISPDGPYGGGRLIAEGS